MRNCRKVTTFVAVFLVVFSASHSAGATVVVNGRTLLFELQRDMAYWNSPTEEGKQFFGQGISYVRGVRDAVWLLNPEGICLPKRASNLELVTAIVERLEDSQDLREAAPAVAVIKAIQEEWPCPEVEEPRSSAPNHSLERPAGAAAQLKPRSTDEVSEYNHTEGLMAVRFATFEFTNRSGLEVSVKLEAPVGTEVGDYTVGPSSTRTFNPGVDDVQSALVKVNDGTHDTTQEVGTSGKPYRSFLEILSSVYNVGSIRGEFKARY